MTKCPHMKACRQKVVKGSLPLCNGERGGFKFDKCFTEHSLDAQGKYRGTELKRTEEWTSEASS